MTETWADTQFELLEAAYNEIPIEAKARIEQLESSLDEVAEKWAIAQVNYEDCARRNTLLEALVRDEWEYIKECCEPQLDFGCIDPVNCIYYDNNHDACLKSTSLKQRIVALGLLDGDAE